MIYHKFLGLLNEGCFDKVMKALYGSSAETTSRQKKRYAYALERFHEYFPNREEISVFSAPGRTEIGGNHTDHQHGCVLAAAVDLDIIAVVSFHNEGVIRLQSEGYPQDYVELSDISMQENEKGKSAALIRGIVSKFHDMGVEVSGFDAYTISNVLSGSGLSSSAAFEVLIGTIIAHNNPDISKENVSDIICKEIGKVFEQVLLDAGVFKRNATGRQAFQRFVYTLTDGGRI